MEAGRDVNIFVNAPPTAPGRPSELIEAVVPVRARSLRDAAPFFDLTSASNPVEAALDAEIDGYRDVLNAGQINVALNLLRKRLSTLPAEASGRIIFRLKANIGHCYQQLGNDAEAQRWLSEAYDAAPNEPKAVANKALALIIGGRQQEAFDFCRDALQRDATNEYAAANLLLAAGHLNIDDPSALIPPAIREREEVVLSRLAFLRVREKQPDWWRAAAKATADFPKNERIQFFASEAILDEITRDPTFKATRIIPPGQRDLLSQAVAFFEARWEKAKQSDAPNGDVAISVLADAMLGRQVLGDFERAIDLAREVVTRTKDQDVLANATQVALFSHQYDLALEALGKLDGFPQANFFKGIIHLERAELADAAKSFEAADIPASEQAMSATVIALAAIEAGGAPAEAAAFDPAIEKAERDPRALILVARIARKHALTELAREMFSKAVGLLHDESTLAERSMVAAYAATDQNCDAVIAILDGHIQEDRPSEELTMLAEAHTLDQPPRRRNLEFFERLPIAIRDLNWIARLRASVLLQGGRYDEAEAVFRSVVQNNPTDPYPVLGLAETLRRLGKDGLVPAIISAVDENALHGPPDYRMQLAHALRRVGASDRALRYAYSLVREASENAKVVLGYVFLILGDRGQKIIPDAPVVAEDCWVEIQNNDGEKDHFVIDNGPSFFGVEVRSIEHPSARRLLGLKVGDEFEVEKGIGGVEHWKVVGIKSKFLNLLHLALEQFGHKFPDASGMWRVPIRDNDGSGVLDTIRQLSEANQERAKAYTEGFLPLSLAARMMGGDDPIGFAQYIRGLGGKIITCVGADHDFADAKKLATDSRGRGVALDLYTVWVAAEIGLLDALRSWFGRLLTPQSTVDAIDKLIAREEEGRGGRTKTVAWRNGQFYGHEITDEYVASQVAALRTIKNAIVGACEIVRPLLPNNLPELSLKLLELFGNDCLDAAYLARSEKVTLLSDDLRYREVARVDAGVPGLWLQATLDAMLESGVIERGKAIEAYVSLAARRHDRIRLDSVILRDVYDSYSDAGLREFDAITEFIGDSQADMRSHTMVVGQFLARLWHNGEASTKLAAATGMLLSKLVRLRQKDWFIWLGLLVFVPGSDFVSYLEVWLKGHFLPVQLVGDAYGAWKLPSSIGRIRAQLNAHGSPLAMVVAGA